MDKKEAVGIYQQRNAKKDDLRTALGWSLEELGADLTEGKTEKSQCFAQCKEAFLDAYRAHTRGGYYFVAKDAGALAQLIKKVEARIKDETGEAPDEETTVATFAAMVTNMPDWYRNNAFSLTAINGNFNALIVRIKHGKKENGGVSSDYLKRQLDILNSEG